jgi:hypothetical protein
MVSLLSSQHGATIYAPLSHQRSAATDASSSGSFSQAITSILKLLWLLALVVVYAFSLVVWLWVQSFRNGWQFWDWAQSNNGDPQRLSVAMLYGFAVLLISPMLLFLDWSQSQFSQMLPAWMNLPVQPYFRTLFRDKLGITLGSEFPLFVGLPAEAAAEVDEGDKP